MIEIEIGEAQGGNDAVRARTRNQKLEISTWTITAFGRSRPAADASLDERSSDCRADLI